MLGGFISIHPFTQGKHKMTNRQAVVTLRKDLEHLNQCCAQVHSQLTAAMIKELLSTSSETLTEVLASIPHATLERIYDTLTRFDYKNK
jgi:hypothetical protein